MIRNFYLVVCFLLSVTIVSGQVNFTGVYGYSSLTINVTEAKEKTAVPGGSLVLIKISGSQYRFWLDVLGGPPAYDRGETDGTITFTNDTASFDNSYEDDSPCMLKFKIDGKTITIENESSSTACGFGNGVTAGGEYTWLTKQEKLDNEWLEKQYPQATKIKVSSTTELYSDPDGYRSFANKILVAKGNDYLNIAESEKTIYTEFISKEGTLKWGWIRKTAIKVDK